MDEKTLKCLMSAFIYAGYVAGYMASPDIVYADQNGWFKQSIKKTNELYNEITQLPETSH